MADSSSFTSLLALVDSHLSKCSMQEGEGSGPPPFPRSIPIPSLRGDDQMSTMSDTRVMSPSQRLPIPTLSASDSPITNILATQLSNMFKAKELKKQQEEEKQRLAEEMKQMKLEEDNCVIDLMQAIQRPSDDVPWPMPGKLSNSSSLESLIFDQQDFFNDMEEDNVEAKAAPILLPCKTDMSYILKEKTMGKCSAFGKVITARVHPVAAPYLREKVDSKVVRFDFSTKSPCDLIKDKLKRPTCHSSNHGDLVAQFLAT